MADAGKLDVDEHLIRAGLLDWNLLVLDGAAGLLDDLRPLLGWDLGGGHVVRVSVCCCACDGERLGDAGDGRMAE